MSVTFTAVRSVGGLFSVDMLVCVQTGHGLTGTAPADYHLLDGRSVRDVADEHWARLRTAWDDQPTRRNGRWLRMLVAALGFDDRQDPPVHLVPWADDLDERPGPGELPPQSLAQHRLNRHDDHRWAVLSNGRRLRLLRRSSGVASYVEFDLEAIFDRRLFEEFLLLYRLLHVSRLGAGWLDRWSAEAVAVGLRALERQREAVKAAVVALGAGFLRHPANGRLRESLDVQEFHDALLRVVVRRLVRFVVGGKPALDAPLRGLSISGGDLRAAVRLLSRVRRWQLGVPELGSIYESLLGLVPRRGVGDGGFELVELAGNRRKTTGSYYTPAALIEALLDVTLEPVLDDAVKRGTAAGDVAGALLSVRVCDPACGSGHFLVAAARRIAKRVAAARADNPEPTWPAVRRALREVVPRCVYGVDLNPMAVELAKVALCWDGLGPGASPSVLDGHLKHGNALIGATPALLGPEAVTKEAADAWCARLTGDGEAAFFHWHLEFPEVFPVPPDGVGADPRTGWAGGFDCVLGNPPWERIKLSEQEFFARHDEAIATAGTAAARRRLIAGLEDDPERRALHAAFATAKRRSEGESRFLRYGGRFPLTGRGDINTYAVFAETGRMLLAERGRMGVIVPTGIATDATTQFFFRDLVRRGAIAALYDFENRTSLFPAVDSRVKFAILSLTGRGLREPAGRFAFFLQDTAELTDRDKVFTLTPEEITLLNPNTGTCPVFRSRRDAEIALGIYRRVPVLRAAGNPWGVSFLRMFDMTNDSHLFRSGGELVADGWSARGNVFLRNGARMLPVYEAKMIHHYDHRWATFADGTIRDLTAAEKTQPEVTAAPRYWVPEDVVEARLARRGWSSGWLLGWRDICRATDERTAIVGPVPRSAVGNNLPVTTFAVPSALVAIGMISMASSLVFDFVARLKVGGTHLNFFIIEQLPVLGPEVIGRHADFLRGRVLELVHTAHDMAALAHDLGDTGAPFRWDPERRSVLRAELDALYFHLYGVNRADVEHILGTFPILRRKEEARHGRYRTRELVLAAYDRMAAGDFGSALDPPPGRGPRCR